MRRVATAEDRVALDDRDAQAGAREIGGEDEAVVARADHDTVECSHDASEFT